MKWMAAGLAAAVILIALGLALNDGGEGSGLSKYPEAVALCEEGTRDMNAFRLRDAVAKLGQCLELDPSLAEASIARTLAFYRLGEQDHFKIELARADSLTGLIRDRQRRMLAQLRLSMIARSRFFAIRDSLRTALSLEIPENIHVLEARVYDPQIMDDPLQQEEAWKDILNVDPNYANSYNMLGYLELNRGNYDKAIEYMQKYAFLAPDLANPHDSMGEVLMVMGRYEDAETEFVNSVKMQPDFYHSLINLGKVYLARGQIRKGNDILEKVRTQVAGSDLEKRVDREVIATYLDADLPEQIDAMTALYVGRYPDDPSAGFYRAVRLAAAGRPQAGQAVMDSSLAKWRQEPSYKVSKEAQLNIDSAARRFDALVADYNDPAATRVRMWEGTISMIKDHLPFHEQWFYRFRLARALRDAGRPQDALAELEAMLKVNPRLVHCLILAVQCNIDQGAADAARQALSQLEWAISKSDPDFYARERAAALAGTLGGAGAGS